MKRFVKFIPLLILPMMLTSCLDMFFTRSENSENGGNSSQTTESSSGSSSSGGGSSSGGTTIYPTSLTIFGASTLYVGEETTLTASYQPSNITYKTVNWYTSDSAIATVTSAGKVKGKAAGPVVITAKLKSADGYLEATHNMTISVPSASSVSLNKTSVTLGFNKTVQLTATVNPAAANQAVTWSSNNNNVATVSNDGLVTSKAVVGNATITATTVDGGKTASCNVSVQEVSGTTVMIYMCGADLESAVPEHGSGYLNSGYQGLASMDIDEILAVNGQPDNVNIVLETGGAAHWAKSNIPNNKLARWEIRNKTMTKIAESGSPNTTVFPTNKNMGLSSTLQSFIEWGLENYPAEKYGLIMWNHGGAMSGCCFDENNGDDSISATELKDAVSNARSNKGISAKFEWITYDACLMAVQDVAEYNSYNFNYMLSSQESESGYGYDYDAWLPSLYNNPDINGGDLLEVIGHTFMVEEKSLYQSWYGSRWAQYFDQTQSVYDLSKVAAYKTAFESLASSIDGVIGTTTSKAKTLGNLINSAKKYGETEDDYGDTIYPFDIFDAKDTINKIVANSAYSSLSSKATAAKNAIDDLVVYEEHGEGTSGCGLCIYCPMSGYSYPYDYNTSAPTTNFTNWKSVANKVFWAVYNS